MLDALLRGKLSQTQENMEDILTSTVFGLLKYAPVDTLWEFLSRAQSIDGTFPLESLVPNNTATWSFWPIWSEEGCTRCEPDVFIELNPGNAAFYIAIEVKLWSSKSSLPTEDGPPNDQLAKEWDNLRSVAERLHINGYFLVYLTPDKCIPTADIEISTDEFQRKRPGTDQPRILWLGWHELFLAFEGHENRICVDLRELAERLNFLPLSNVPELPIPGHIHWSFDSTQDAFFAAVPQLQIPPPCHWEFTP